MVYWGDIMDVEIVGMNHHGDGIGKIHSKVIFVPRTFVGDVVRLKDIIEYKNYSIGVVDYFIQYSDDKVEVRCPYYEKCGGCQIMGICYEKQLEYKRDKVINIFQRYCDMDIKPEIVGSDYFGYRNKVVFQVKDGKVGYFEGKSHNFVEVDNCLLILDKMNEVLSIIRNDICLDGIDKIIMRDSLDGVMVVFYGDIHNIDIGVLKEKVCSIYVNNKKIYGKDMVIMGLCDYRFVISPNSFFQVNLGQTERLYEYVKKCIHNRPRLLDLYCGVGSIGIFCADKCKEVVGIEINQDAIDNANINKKINHIDNIRFMCLNANKIHYNEGDFDAVIVDPPRGGLDSKTIQMIKKIHSRMVIYVSCNPITLVRDFNYLSDQYNLTDIRLFDMFPNTYHVECCSLLCLKEN